MEDDKIIIDNDQLTNIPSWIDSSQYSGSVLSDIASNYSNLISLDHDHANDGYISYNSNSNIFNQYVRYSDLLKEAFNIISDISYLDDGIVDFINKLYVAGIITDEDVKSRYGSTDVIKIQV